MSVLSLVRKDPTYFTPLKPKVRIRQLEDNDTLLTFDAYDLASADMNVIYVDAEKAIQEVGTGNVVIEDSANTLNKDHIKSVRVELSFAKPDVIVDHNGNVSESAPSTGMIPFLSYISDVVEYRRPRNFYQEYLLSGPGTKSKAADLMLLVRKSTKKVNNPDYSVAQLVLDMLHARKSTPLNEQDADELWRVSSDLVSDGGQVSDDLTKVYYNVVNEVFTTIYDFYERMAAFTGADWDVVYSPDFGDILQFQYPPALHSGIRVKSVDLASATDNKKKTSYIMDGFTFTYNASSDANVKTDLFTTTVIDSTVISSQNSAIGFSSLTNKAIAQQLEIDNGDRRIVDLMFILSKIGEPESPKNQINCDLVLDDSANHPTGPVLATFKIPLDDIKTSPTSVFVNDVDVKIRFLQGSNKIWLRMFQRSDKKGNPNTDELNTVRWHHNAVFNTGQTFYNATAPGGDYKTKDQLVWTATNAGPRYAYSVFSKINRLLSIRNQSAAKRIGTKQAFIDTSQFSTDPTQIQQYLSFLLTRMSKPRLSTSAFKATVPNQFLFKPYQGVSFEDSLSNLFYDLQVQRSRIVVSALPGETNTIGAYFQEITLGGSENALVGGSCSCS